MNNIPTAEEFYLNPNSYITKKMIEFAQLHVEAALKSAAEKAEGFSEGNELGVGIIIDKRTILNAYPKENIK